LRWQPDLGPAAFRLAGIRTFLASKFSTEEHFRRRVEKLAELEQHNWGAF